MGKETTKMATGRGRGGRQKLTPRKILAADRTREAIELRLAGASFRAIAESLGYVDKNGNADPGSAWKAVQRGLAASIREPAHDLITLELERLDGMFLAIYPQARKGILGAVDRCLRIQERRSRLLGLDAPVKIETNWRKAVDQQGVNADDLFETLVTGIMTGGLPTNGDGAPSA